MEEDEHESSATKQSVCVHVKTLQQHFQCLADSQFPEDSSANVLQMLVPLMSADVLLEVLKQQVLVFLKLSVDSSSLDKATGKCYLLIDVVIQARVLVSVVIQAGVPSIDLTPGTFA